MIFSLEVFKARHGDCALLHYGETDRPRLVLIDGGPRGVYRQVLRPRLETLRAERSPEEPLEIELVVVSHIDESYMTGIQELLDEILDSSQQSDAGPVHLKALWHNTFDSLAGNHAEELLSSARVEVGPSLGAAVPMAGLSFGASRVLASVSQDRRLRHQAEYLDLTINLGLPILTSDAGSVQLSGGLRLTILGPLRRQAVEQQEAWERLVRESWLEVTGGLVNAAAIAEHSVYRLSSLVLLAEVEGRTLLLPGDAPGDQILEGLREAGLLAGGRFHVDVLRVPGHGGSRNVDVNFFEAVTADHYVFSADGGYGNPDPATVEMILRARRGDDFRLYLNYPLDDLRDRRLASELQSLLEARGPEAKFTVVTAADADSLIIDLLEPLAGPRRAPKPL